MKKIWRAIAGLTVVGLASTVQAEVIKFTDDKGTISFVDDLSKVPKKYRKNVVREQEQDAVRVISDESTGQSGAGGGDVVQICFHRGLKVTEGGQTLLDFLKQERRPYRAMDLYRHPEHIDECVSIYCNHFMKSGLAQAQNYTMPLCVTDASNNFKAGVALPFIQYRGKYYQNDSQEFVRTINKNSGFNPAADW